jgi:hypothetical protein
MCHHAVLLRMDHMVIGGLRGGSFLVALVNWGVNWCIMGRRWWVNSIGVSAWVLRICGIGGNIEVEEAGVVALLWALEVEAEAFLALLS